jgi:hypothetical protein
MSFVGDEELIQLIQFYKIIEVKAIIIKVYLFDQLYLTIL